MPSQQLPKSAKLDSLPDDLKAIAEKLIKDKFKLKEEKPQPEIVNRKKPEWPDAQNMYKDVYMSRRRYALVPVGYSKKYDVRSRMYQMGGAFTAPPVARVEYFEVVDDPRRDPREIGRQVDMQLDRLEMQTGYVYEARSA